MKLSHIIDWWRHLSWSQAGLIALVLGILTYCLVSAFVRWYRSPAQQLYRLNADIRRARRRLRGNYIPYADLDPDSRADRVGRGMSGNKAVQR